MSLKILSTALFVFAYSAPLQAATVGETCQKLFAEGLSQQAVTPCTQAAKANDRAAQTTLGEIYDEKGDSEKTALWWRQAADAGYQPARNLLALKYYYGGTVFGVEKGWEKSYPKAFEIWHQDAKKNIATSQFMVGVMYHKGQGVGKNLPEAWYWLKLALGNGYKTATDVLIEISKEITPQQKRLGEEKVAEHKQKMSKKTSL
ncbi:MAG TPA: sel1 repeat family protein [Leucothrix mucor]|nr:sel1 repeat family protein [Leucothrix mucor]